MSSLINFFPEDTCSRESVLLLVFSHCGALTVGFRFGAAANPSWLRVERVDPALLAEMALDLDPGEREAIALARELQAELVVIDDQAGRREARRWHLTVTGMLGMLRAAAAGGLVDFREVLDRLQQTNFYISAELLQQLLNEDDSSP